MARLALTAQTMLAKYPATPLVAGASDVTWTPSGAAFADGFGFPLTGQEILLVYNTNAGVQTVTISSVNDAQNRSGTITAYSMAAGDVVAFGPFPPDGWRQSDGKLYGAVSAADISLAVLKLPS